MQIIITNKIRCKKCGDVIESEYTHDFKMCRCGACAVDGGHDYLRRLGNPDDWEELSETMEEPDLTLEEFQAKLKRQQSVDKALAILLTATDGVNKPFQDALDEYVAGEITLDELEARVDNLEFLDA